MRRRKKETKQEGKSVEVEVAGEVLGPASPMITPRQLNVGSDPIGPTIFVGR